MINILFCGNDGVFDGMLTCALSIFRRTSTDAPFRFFIFTMDASHLKNEYLPINDDKSNFFEKLIKEYDSRNSVVRIDVTELYREEFSGCPNEEAYCSPYTLLRLLADRIENIPDKLLYLDVDVMFNRDIALLYDIDIDGYEYAAARDHYGKYLIAPDYINAGVLLLNMKEIRDGGLFRRARDLIRKNKLTFADQSAIIRATKKKKLLPQKFNDQKFLHNHTVVRHFSKRLFWLPYPHTENIKQWQVSRVHRRLGCYAFDDILYEYIYLKEKYNREVKND